MAKRDAIADFDADRVLTASAKVPFMKKALYFIMKIAAILAIITLPLLWSEWRAIGRLPFPPLWANGQFGDWFRVLFMSSNPTAIMEGFAALALSMGVFVWGIRKKKWLNPKSKPKASALHGTAGWADFDTIKEMEILPPSVTDPKRNAGVKHSGVFIGSYIHQQRGMKPKTYYLRHDGPEHILAFAPTRSGKGVGLVLPTLLTWDQSAIVHDPKGEAWALTAGFRSNELGQNVYCFDPASPDTTKVSAFNPLAEIRVGTLAEVADAQNLATILADPEGKGLKDHWAKTSQALLSGLILHVCYFARNELGRPARFSDIVDFLSNPDDKPESSYGAPQQQQEGGLQKRLKLMQEYHHTPEGPHPMVAQEATSMLEKEERERASVASTAVSFLTLYRDPAIAMNTGRSDWTISDLMDGDRPATAYLVVRPSDADRLRPLIRLIMTQIVRKLTKEMGFKDGRSVANYKHRLLLLLDEFTALKKLTVIEEALAYMAGYGLKAYLIVQDIQQLEAVYGKEEMVLSNCHIKVCFAPNKIQTAEVISKMVGKRTVVHKAARTGGGKDQGESWQETARDLMTPEEAMRLEGPKKDRLGNIQRPGALLVVIAGKRPIYGTQVLYFRDSVLLKRSMIDAPILMNGEIGDTKGYAAVPRSLPDHTADAVELPSYKEDEDVDHLLLMLEESPLMGDWPAAACSGEPEDVRIEISRDEMLPDVAEALAMIEAHMDAHEEASESTMVLCRDMALTYGSMMPALSSDVVNPKEAIPESRLAELRAVDETSAA